MRRNWRDEARKAILELRGVGHGTREAEMQTIARQLNGHTDTSALRRAIAAYEFLDNLRISKPASYAQLDGAPLSIVEMIARWFAFDPSAALKAADDWANGKGNVRSIGKAMQASRPTGYAGRSGIALGRAYVTAAKPVVLDAVERLIGRDVIPTDISIREEATGQTLDFVFVVPDGGDMTIAVVVVGPYSNRKLYGSRAGDWVTKAFGLAWLFERVVLALPFVEALPAFEKKIAAVNRAFARTSGSSVRHPPVVDVVHIDVPELTPEEDEMVSELSGQASS